MVAGEFGVTRGCVKPLVTGGSGRDVLPKVWMTSLVSIPFFLTRFMTSVVSKKSMLNNPVFLTGAMQPLVSNKSMFNNPVFLTRVMKSVSYLV